MDNLQLGIKITADGTGASATLTSLNGNLNTLGRTASQSAASIDGAFSSTRRGLNSISQQLEQMRNLFAGFAAARTFIDMSKGVVDLAAQYDRLNHMMVSASGGLGLSASNMAFARKISNDLGLDLVTTTSAFAKLTAASRGTALQGDQTRAIFEAVSRATSSLGLSSEESSGALLAVSQMMSKGKVSAEELRGQLGERLPGAFNVMAQALGVSTAKLDDMLQKGDVLATDALPKFAKALDEAYSGARFDGITNNVNRLNNAWTTFINNLTPTDAIKSTLNILTQSLNGWNSIAGKKTLDEQINAEIKSITELSNSPKRSQYLYQQEVEKSIASHQKLLDLLIEQKKVQDSQLETERSKAQVNAGAPSVDEVQQMVAAAAKKYGVSEAFALAIAKAESDFIQTKVSAKGAVGVGQLMPDTAKRFGVDAKDVTQNIDGMMRYLKLLSTKFNNDLRLVAASYNAGEDSVSKAGNRVPAYAETQSYVAKVERFNEAFLAKYPSGLPLADSQSRKKEIEEAYQQFKVGIDKMVADAENAGRLSTARHRTEIDQIELERKTLEQATQDKIAGTTVFVEKMAISEQGRQQQIALIERESVIQRQAFDEEQALLQTRLDANNRMIEGQDGYNRSIQETAQLRQESSALETSIQMLSEQRAQAEIDAQTKINEAGKQGISIKEQQANAEQSVREEALRTLEVLSSNLEYAKEMASGLASAFGDVGSSIGNMVVSLAEYAKQQETINIQAAEAIKKNPAKAYDIQQEAALKQSRNQIKTYGDLTQAAQGFFKKGTKGYESLGAAVKVFRAFEIAESALSFAQQLGDMGKLFGSFESMLKQMGLLSDINRTKEVTNAMAAGQAKAAEGAANQGSSGDPYTAFARVAAWIALMAGIGFMVGGSGSSAKGVSVSDIQKQQDEAFKNANATMLGSQEMSTSIVDSLELIAQNSTNDLDYTKGMARDMELLVSAIASVSTAVAKGFNFDVSKLNLGTTKSSNAPGFDPLSGFIWGGSSISRELLGQGIKILTQTLGYIVNDSIIKAQGYAEVLITKKTSTLLGLISSSSQTIERSTSKLDQEILRSLTQVFRHAYDTLVDTGELLGKGAADLAKQLQSLKLKMPDIKLGKNAEENAKKIEAAISAQLDKWAAQVFPDMRQFQRAGEGMYETSVRVAEGIARASGQLDLLGMQAINYTSIVSDHKDQIDVAAEITRQTIMAQGDLSEGTRKYVDQLKGSSADIVDAYKKIVAIENLMRAGGFGTNGLDQAMINAGGGLDAFTSALQAFYDNFLNDNQKVTAKTNELTAAFGRLGFSLPKSKDEFYRLVSGIDQSTDAGKKLFAQIIGLSQGFSDLQDALSAQAQAAQDAADAALKQQEELKKAEVDRLTAIQKQQEDIASQAKKAYDDANTALSKAFDDLTKVQQRFETIGSNLSAYLKELTGATSTNLSPEARYRAAQSEFNRIRDLAASGNEDALSQLVSAGKDFLTASKDYNASSAAYQIDYQAVLKSLEDGQAYAEGQVQLAQAQLDYAKASYSQLVKVDTSVLSITGAIGNLTNAMSNFAQASIANSAAAAEAAAAAARTALS